MKKTGYKKAVAVSRKLKIFALVAIFLFFLAGGVRKTILAWRNGWSAHRQANLFIVDGERSYLLLLSPSTQDVKMWIFPASWQLDLFGGFGRYWAKGLAKFAFEEKSAKILTNTLMMELGLPIDFWIYNDQSVCHSQKISDCLASDVWQSGFLGRANWAKGSRMDFFKIALFLRRNRRWQIFDAKEENFLKNISAADSSGLVLDHGRWDKLALDLLIDPAIRNESVPLGVYNVSSRSGVAKTVSRILVNVGAEVVAVSNRKKELPAGRCLITIKNQSMKKKIIFKRLVSSFNCLVKEKPRDDFSDLTDINLYFGGGWATGR